jgi:hypothetical protein
MGVDVGRGHVPCSRSFLSKFSQHIKLFSTGHAATNPKIANDSKQMSVQATAPVINDSSWRD